MPRRPLPTEPTPSDAERVRIVQELHDVIAHQLGIIAVQAAAARKTAGDSPDRMLAALESIESVSREALSGMRVLLTLDDAGNDRAPRAPQPTLERLPALLDRVRDAGIVVEFASDEMAGLPAALDVSAYRIIHDVLTDLVAHSRASRAGVELRLTPTRIEVAITHYGPASRMRDTSVLRGLSERVRLLGGEISAAPFALRASLPLAQTCP